jgi:methyl-accepting chemotaxis protein
MISVPGEADGHHTGEQTGHWEVLLVWRDCHGHRRLCLHLQIKLSMKFNTRLLLCALIPAALFVSALVVSLWGLMRTQSEFDGYIKTEQAIANGLTEMYAQGLQTGQALRNVVLDPANTKAYENFSAGAAAYDQAQAQTARIAAGTEVGKRLQAMLPLRENQVTQQKRVLDLVKSDPAEAIKVLNVGETPAWRQLREKLVTEISSGRELALSAQQATRQRADRMISIAVGLAIVAALASMALVVLMRRTVQRELGGDPADVRRSLQQLANGDLTSAGGQVAAPEGVMAELLRTRHKLRDLVAHVQKSAGSISISTQEIASGNNDLSARTEQQAAALEETAASMEQLGSTVRQNADNARQANQMAVKASTVAVLGGNVVAEVVETMKGINSSSNKIADIIGVIDGIAFQTNILALNAAVEAARAGEQGRGFAVVASEVRSLAGRSAEAAREIKGLITASVERVEQGTVLVDKAGATMTEVVSAIRKVTDIMGEISSASSEQSAGVGQVGEAVTQMDHATQQNAALVEEMAAAASSLNSQARELVNAVAVFKIDGAGAGFVRLA